MAAETKVPKARSAKKPAAKSAAKIRITQVLSPIGFDKSHGITLRGLGLRRVRHTVEVPDNAGIRGMIHKVRHLVRVEN